MKRRGFVKLCASAVAGITASPELLAREHQVYRRYARVALIDPYTREPVRASGSMSVKPTCFTTHLSQPRVF